MTRTAEDTVRAFYACYTEARPCAFDSVVAADYCDFGHDPPGRGPAGARADYHHAVLQAGGVTRYTIDALVADDEHVAVAWTAELPSGEVMRGLSLYVVRDGLIRSTRHARVGR